MMERNYPTSSFSDPLTPAAQSAAWAYERAGLKPSLSYGAGHAEAELLHRQAYTAAQLPAYSATHHPAGLAGLFDTSLHGAGINTTETSVMNFLSAIESRTAASSGATLLPQFRASSWQTGMHSSADLFVTGALPTSGTFPPTSALSAYQHPSSFSSRNFVTTPSLSLQDGTFNSTSNGILSHDPLLQLKTSPCAIPTALTFDRLSSSVLASSLPIQSSTYRSAQESAPHLLQPQFSLLPSALAGAQQASQAYSTAVFAGSPASIERALQRECSVIKHHQRPSSSQSVQAQLAGSHHSLQTYLPSAGGINFHDTTRQSTLSCSPLVDITQVSNGGLPKTSRVTVELAQSYTSAIPSSGYPLSSVKGKNCSTKPPPISTKTSKPQNVVLPVQTQSYNKSAQSQSSVIASQAQIYSSAQLPNLLAVSQAQTYVSTQSPNMSTVSDSQAFSPLKSEKLPLLYKSMNTFSSLSQAITSDSQTLNYSAGQQHSLPQVSNESYSDQARNISSSTPSQSYKSNQPQCLSPVSQSPVNYTSQSHGLSVSPSVSYASRQHLTSPAPSLPFSSSSGAQNMSGSSPTPNYISLASSQSSQTQDSTSPQSQTFSPVVQSPFASPTRSQALQNNRLSTDAKSYVSKRKLQSSVYSPPKQDTDFPMQDLQELQQHQTSLESSTQRLAGGGMSDQESAYRVSKTDDRYHSPSVIRSSSRLDDQGVLPLHRSKTDERLVSSVVQLSQQIDHIDSMISNDLKRSANLMPTSHEQVRTEELNHENQIRNKVHEAKAEEHPSRETSSTAQVHTPTLSHTQTVLDSSCDLHMLQPSFLQSNYEQTKGVVLQSHNPQHITHPFLQLNSHIIPNSGGQQHRHPQRSETLKNNIICPPKALQSQQLTTKDNFTHPDQHDSKNQFLPLGSLCFPESMLLPDERHILSNVDDILAATAAACGLSTQEFAKVSTDEGTQSVENIHESKANFQLGVGHVSPSFTPSQAPVPPHDSTSAASPNSCQMQQNLSPLNTIQSNVISAGEVIEMSDQNVPSGIGSPTFRPVHKEQEQITLPSGQSTKNQNIQEEHDAEERTYNNNIVNQNLSSSTNSLGEETAMSDDDISMCVDNENVTSNEANMSSPVKSETQPCANSLIVSEGENQAATQCNLHTDQEMENNSKSPISEDENENQNLQNGSQAKRLISKGIDLSLPCSPADIAESYFDSSQHQERIRQKIKEVEEQQPEVKCGFIGSFLDFLKGDPKIPTSKAPNRAKRPAAPILRAPFLQHVPFKNLPLMTTLGPQDSVVTKTEKEVDDELKKNLETLPSFSSSDEDSGGGRDLQKSISTALSALDHAAEKLKNSESTKSAKVTAAPAVIKEPACVTSPAIKVEEKPKAIEPPKLPTTDSSLARKQDTVAFLGITDDENSDSGGEGTYRERDEFVVKIDDIEALQLALSIGEEPPAIWRVQKALLQKFVPELRYGIRQYSATNSYLGYFGDAKTKYKRVYAKFIENANKKEYVRLCSKKPKLKAAQPARTGHTKVTGGNKASESTAPNVIATKVSSMKSKAKQTKVKAEPPPKKRKTWKGEFSSPSSDKPPEVQNEEDGSVCEFLSSPRTSRRATVQSIPIAMDVDPPPDPKEPLSVLKDSTVASKPPLPTLIQLPPAPSQPPPALIQAPNTSQQPPTTLKQPAPSLKRAPLKRAPAKRAAAKRAAPPPKQAPLRTLTEMQPEQSASEIPQPQSPLTEKPQSPIADKQLPQALPTEEPLPQSPPPNEPASQLTSLDKEQSHTHVEAELPHSPPAEKQPPQTPPADKQPPLTPKKTPTTPKQSVITPDTPPFASRSLRTRAMKETFRSYMELLVSVALDADTMQALEKSDDELLLPHMRKIEGMINEGCSKVLDKLNLTQSHKTALENFPELTVMTRENKSKKGGPPISKIKVNGKAYNKKTLRNIKSNKSSQEFTVDPARTQLCSLYHSLHHYRYHVYLICKDEIATVVKANADLGQEQIVQLCMKNMTWVETLFERFGELLGEVQEKCG